MIRSLNTGVGGIRNFQTSLDVIANNLANLNTVGFKGGRVDFAEALTQTVRPSTPDAEGGNASGSSSIQVSNGVNTNSVTTLFSQGAVNQTGKITDLALAGEGYFILKKGATEETGSEDGGDEASSGGMLYATRAGDFRLDSNGYLVNNAGMRVQGVSDYIEKPDQFGDITFDRGEFMASIDVQKGSSNNKSIETAKAHGLKTGNVVVFKGDTMPAALSEATPYFVKQISDTEIALYSNLHQATTDVVTTAVANVPIGNGVNVSVNPSPRGYTTGDTLTFSGGGVLTLTADANAGATTLTGNLTESGIASGDITGLDNALEIKENEIDVTGMRVIKKLESYESVKVLTQNDESALTSDTAHGFKDGDKVRFYITNNNGPKLEGEDDVIDNSHRNDIKGANDGDGFSRTYYVSLKGEKSFSLHNSPEDASLRIRPVDFDNPSLAGTAIVKVASSTTAKIQNISVDTSGRVNVMLTDGTQYTRGQVMLKKFANEQALSKEGGNIYSNLENAGVSKKWGAAGSDGFGIIESGALELSNVDVAREFSKLITTQRAFQANSRMVSASDEILMELLRLKR